ncbi:unnamed protein product [Linum trigynum]|uniref:Uncharacterized protein n=1 Tax=Linum trigynum TaxID=586398 RepID=A0AAV2EPH6_9ROSI
MPPRLREQEGELSPGFVKELAIYDLGQLAKSDAGNNGGVRGQPSPTQCLGVTTTTLSLHQSLVVEIKLMEEAMVGYTKQMVSQLDCFHTRLNRRLDQLDEICEINENNCKKFRQLLMKSVLRSKVLAKDDVDPPSSVATGDTSILNFGGRTTQPRSENSSSPVTSQPPLQRGGCGENLTPTFTTHVKKLPIQTITLETASEARPCLNVKLGAWSLTTNVFPQGCPAPLLSTPIKPGGCNPRGGQAEGYESLPPDKLTVKYQAGGGGHVDVKENGKRTLFKDSPHFSSKCGKNDMSLSPCSGQGGMPSNMMNGVSGKSKDVLDTHTTNDFHNFDSMSKSGHGGKAPCSMPPMNGRQRGMSPTTNNRQIDILKKPQHEAC